MPSLTTLTLFLVVLALYGDAELIQGTPKRSKPRSNGSGPSSLNLLLERDFELLPRACVNPGYVPCSGNNEFCCPPGDNCQINLGQCCPKSGQTCGGRICCPGGDGCCQGGRYCCKPKEQCCDNECCFPGDFCCNDGDGCCENGAHCCPGTCCPSGSTCAGNGLCRIGGGPAPTPEPEPEPGTTTTTKVTSKGIPTPTKSTFAQEPTFSLPSISLPATASVSSSAPTPTITFVYVPGLTDVICANMCLGIRKKGNILTYDPSNKPAKRAAAGCVTGFCNYRTTGRSCDEYPFASTAEGGAGAQIACVPAYQNSIQGIYLNSWRSFVGLRIGQKFAVEIKGLDCSTVVSVNSKRSEVQLAGYNATVLPPLAFGDQNLNHIVLPVGDLDAGTYTMRVNTDEGLQKSFVLLENDGEAHAQQLATSSVDFFQLVLTTPAMGMALAIYTPQKSMNVTFNFNGTELSTTTSNARVPMRAQNAIVIVVIGLVWVGLL